MNRVVVKAKAKVNLSLDVIGIRDNGYHEMKMINHFINLEDILTFETSDEGITLTSNEDGIPLDEKNLVMVALRKLQKQFNIEQGVKIHIDKRIPAEAGLAGGSSDAAATLKGLNSVWNLNLNTQELLEIAVTIGADVPYCLVGGTALVEGIGEKITPLTSLKKMYIVAVKPDINIATPWAFKQLDQRPIKNHPDIAEIIRVLEEKNYNQLKYSLGNVFEEVVFEQHPEISEIKKDLIKQGAMAATMTGSGSTVIGYYMEKETAEKSWRLFADKYSKCFLSETIENEGEAYVE